MIRLGSRTKLAVRCVAYSPDGKFLATGGEDRAVSLWELPSGNLAARFTGHIAGVHSVAFHPNGKVLASGGGKGDFRLWELPSGEPLPAPKWTGIGFVACLGYDLRGARLYACSREVGGGGSIGGGSAAYASTKEKMSWTLLDDGDVYAMAPSPRHNQYAIAIGARGDAGTANQVHLRTVSRKSAVSLQHSGRVWSLAFSSNGDWLASAAGYDVYLRSLTTPDEAVVLHGHERAVRSVAFSPAGGLLVSGGLDGKVILWNVAQGSISATYNWEIDAVYAVAVAPDGLTVAVAGQEGTAVFDTDGE